MKYFLMILVAIIFLQPIIVQAENYGAYQITDLTKPIIVAKKSLIFTLVLKSNATTGFSWFLAKYDHNAITPISQQYHPPISQLVGAPGISVWKFKLSPQAFLVPQQFTLQLIYRRPWTEQDITLYKVTVITTP